MSKNLIETWQKGKHTLNGWLTIPSPWTAEVLAQQGYDSMTVDMQHGLIDYGMALSMFQAMSGAPVTPMVRVNWNEPGSIMKVLDAGAMGVICPMTNTREEVERFVGACRYAPQGYRSFGPVRAALDVPDYFETANEKIITLAMVETAEAVRNIQDIVSVPGLTGIYVGPSDLRISMGISVKVPFTDPVVDDAFNKIITAAKNYGVVAGIHTNGIEDAWAMIEKGFQFITVSSDTRLITVAAQEVVTALKPQEDTPEVTPY